MQGKIDNLVENLQIAGWPLLGNEGMNPQYTNVKVDSLIPYESGQLDNRTSRFWNHDHHHNHNHRDNNHQPSSSNYTPSYTHED